MYTLLNVTKLFRLEQGIQMSIPLYVVGGNNAEKSREEDSLTLAKPIAVWQESPAELRKSMGTVFEELKASTLS